MVYTNLQSVCQLVPPLLIVVFISHISDLLILPFCHYSYYNAVLWSSCASCEAVFVIKTSHILWVIFFGISVCKYCVRHSAMQLVLCILLAAVVMCATLHLRMQSMHTWQVCTVQLLINTLEFVYAVIWLMLKVLPEILTVHSGIRSTTCQSIYCLLLYSLSTLLCLLPSVSAFVVDVYVHMYIRACSFQCFRC